MLNKLTKNIRFNFVRKRFYYSEDLYKEDKNIISNNSLNTDIKLDKIIKNQNELIKLLNDIKICNNNILSLIKNQIPKSDINKDK